MFDSESLQQQPQRPSPPRTNIRSHVNKDDIDIDDCQRRKQRPPPPPPKGLSNHSGTACYINSSILLLCYTCTPIVTQYIFQIINAITNLSSNISTERKDRLYDHHLPSHHHHQPLQLEALGNQRLDDYEYELIFLLCNILRVNSTDADDDDVVDKDHHDESSTVVNPTRFYQSLLCEEIPAHHSQDPNSNLFQIRYTTCGDAVSTLIQLIQFLQHKLTKREDEKYDNDGYCISNQKGNATIQQPLSPSHTPSLSLSFNLVERLLHTGQAYSMLTGTNITTSSILNSNDININSTTKVNSRPSQTKVLKLRPLTNPVSMSILSQQHDLDISCGHRNEIFPTLHDVLYNTFCTEQHVMGYTWNHMSHADDDSASSTVTTRRLHVVSFPPIFMIHLQRFTINGGSIGTSRSNTNIHVDDMGGAACNDSPRVKPLEDCNSHIVIPTDLDMSIYVSVQPPKEEIELKTVEGDVFFGRPNVTSAAANATTSSSLSCTPGNIFDDHYHLVGGILHIHDYDDDDTDEGSIGHYVTVVRQRSNEHQYQWYVIDDELVTPVSVDQVVLWLGGGWYDDLSKCKVEDSNHCGGSAQVFARGVLLVYHQRHDCDPTHTDWDVIPTSMFRDLSLVTRFRFGTSRKQNSAPRLQPVIALASTKDTFPGTDTRTSTQVTIKYWLNDSDDDDDE